jgi:hypothetical protein
VTLTPAAEARVWPVALIGAEQQGTEGQGDGWVAPAGRVQVAMAMAGDEEGGIGEAEQARFLQDVAQVGGGNTGRLPCDSLVFSLRVWPACSSSRARRSVRGVCGLVILAAL